VDNLSISAALTFDLGEKEWALIWEGPLSEKFSRASDRPIGNGGRRKRHENYPARFAPIEMSFDRDLRLCGVKVFNQADAEHQIIGWVAPIR
jgi:hypothetical protein